jgi:hypothetical protein
VNEAPSPHLRSAATDRQPAFRALTGSSFFPNLISAPFRNGLHEAFLFAIVACLIAAAASLMRGGHPAHDEDPAPARAPIPRRLLAVEPEKQPAR